MEALALVRECDFVQEQVESSTCALHNFGCEGRSKRVASELSSFLGP